MGSPARAGCTSEALTMTDPPEQSRPILLVAIPRSAEGGHERRPPPMKFTPIAAAVIVPAAVAGAAFGAVPFAQAAPAAPAASPAATRPRSTRPTSRPGATRPAAVHHYRHHAQQKAAAVASHSHASHSHASHSQAGTGAAVSGSGREPGAGQRGAGPAARPRLWRVLDDRYVGVRAVRCLARERRHADGPGRPVRHPALDLGRARLFRDRRTGIGGPAGGCLPAPVRRIRRAAVGALRRLLDRRSRITRARSPRRLRARLHAVRLVFPILAKVSCFIFTAFGGHNARLTGSTGGCLPTVTASTG